MDRNIKLILEYDGTHYHGWQSQAMQGKPTIQETLEQSLKRLTGYSTLVYSSGRTDAGVHALGHVANFKTSSRIPSSAWAPALNHLLPDDIRVLSSEEVPEDFHARYSAQGKIYSYRILNRREPTALERKYVWHVPQQLNISAMKTAAAILAGRHDFSSFRASGCGAASPVRTVRLLVVKKIGKEILITIEADAFLQHMVRIIVGTLVDVGRGRFCPEDMQPLLLSCDRRKAGQTAPARGLSLMKVLYGNDSLERCGGRF
ncbi:MAG: tRNA pseudouridine(38-40) synthase TruA [Nitrospirota bacterium]